MIGQVLSGLMHFCHRSSLLLLLFTFAAFWPVLRANVVESWRTTARIIALHEEDADDDPYDIYDLDENQGGADSGAACANDGDDDNDDDDEGDSVGDYDE